MRIHRPILAILCLAILEGCISPRLVKSLNAYDDAGDIIDCVDRARAGEFDIDFTGDIRGWSPGMDVGVEICKRGFAALILEQITREEYDAIGTGPLTPEMRDILEHGPLQ